MGAGPQNRIFRREPARFRRQYAGVELRAAMPGLPKKFAKPPDLAAQRWRPFPRVVMAHGCYSVHAVDRCRYHLCHPARAAQARNAPA